LISVELRPVHRAIFCRFPGAVSVGAAPEDASSELLPFDSQLLLKKRPIVSL
jgi:hypothetical protein